VTWPNRDRLATNSALPGTASGGLSSFTDYLRHTAPELLPAGIGGTGAITPSSQLPHGTTIVALKYPGGVLLAGDRRSTIENGKGLLENVKPGNRVTIVYEVPDAKLVARQIDQTSKTHIGKLAAVDLTGNTITTGEGAKHDKEFHLTEDCAIMNADKAEGRLKELRVGQKYELSYDEINGVNVVNRIAVAPAESPNRADVSRQPSPVGLTQY